MITSLIKASYWGLITIIFWIGILLLSTSIIIIVFIGYVIEQIGNFIDWIFKNDKKNI